MNLNIKARREAAGMTQQELAKAAGKSFRTIQSWERDLSYPNAEMVWRLCEIFKVDPNEFLGWYEDHPRDETKSSSSPEEAELMRNYRACTSQWKSTISMTARAAAGESREEAERDAPARAVSEAV